MAKFIISGSRGTDDPTMATLPFMAAKTAKEQGHDVVLWLWNEAVTLGTERNRRSCDRGEPDTAERCCWPPCKRRICRSGSAGPVLWLGRSAQEISLLAPPSKGWQTISKPSPSVIAM